jgi:hypothetical protein
LYLECPQATPKSYLTASLPTSTHTYRLSKLLKNDWLRGQDLNL